MEFQGTIPAQQVISSEIMKIKDKPYGDTIYEVIHKSGTITQIEADRRLIFNASKLLSELQDSVNNLRGMITAIEDERVKELIILMLSNQEHLIDKINK